MRKKKIDPENIGAVENQIDAAATTEAKGGKRNMREKIIRVFALQNGVPVALDAAPEFLTTADAWVWLADFHAVPGRYYVSAGFEGTVNTVEVKPKVKITF